MKILNLMFLLIIGIIYNCASIGTIISFPNTPLSITIICKTVFKFVENWLKTCNLDITRNGREGTNNLKFNTYYLYVYIFKIYIYIYIYIIRLSSFSGFFSFHSTWLSAQQTLIFHQSIS